MRVLVTLCVAFWCAAAFKPTTPLYLRMHALTMLGDVNSETLSIWRSVKTTLPPVVTGAYKPDRGDAAPGQALYNMIVVRIPTLLCTLWYAKSLAMGGGLFSLDFGFGPWEAPPTLVAIVVYIILM
jgi:hypothetical protein